MLAERIRIRYNTVRPHSSLGYNHQRRKRVRPQPTRGMVEVRFSLDRYAGMRFEHSGSLERFSRESKTPDSLAKSSVFVSN